MSFPEQIVGIYLKRHQDRWGRFKDDIQNNWPDDWPEVQQFNAIDRDKLKVPDWFTGSVGVYGSFLNHITIIENAYRDNISSILIFEDDAVPVKNLSSQWSRIANELLKHKWNWLYLGGQMHGMRKYFYESDTFSLVKPSIIWRSHAYMLKRSAIELILDEKNNWFTYHDNHFGALHASGKTNVLCIEPWLFNVRGEESSTM